MSIHVWAFLGIAVAVIVSPGPDTVVVTKNAVVHGRRAGLGTAFGVNSGLVVWTVAAAIGVAALVRESAVAFTALKLVGAVYLICLGLQALLRSRLTRVVALGSAFARASSATSPTRRSPCSSPCCCRSSSRDGTPRCRRCWCSEGCSCSSTSPG